MSKPNYRIISQAEYEHYCFAGEPFCGYVEGLGFAISEIVVTGYTTNRSRTESFYDIKRINVCVIDYMQESFEYKQWKQETQAKLIKLVNEYYNSRKMELNPLDHNYKFIYGKLEYDRSDIVRRIENEDSQLSTTDFPLNLRLGQEGKLIDQFVKDRSAKVGYPSIRRKDELKEGLTPEQQYILDSYYLDPFATQMALRPEIQACALGGFAVVGSTFLIESGALSVSAKYAGYKAFGSIAGQTLINNSVEQLNITSVVGDAFLAPGAGAFIGSFAEWKPLSKYDKFILTGYNKSFQDFQVDLSTSYLYSKIGGNLINKCQPTLRATGERIFYNINFNVWLYYGNYETSKKLKEK